MSGLPGDMLLFPSFAYIINMSRKEKQEDILWQFLF